MLLIGRAGEGRRREDLRVARGALSDEIGWVASLTVGVGVGSGSMGSK